MGCAQSTTNEDPKSENEAKNEVGSSSSSSSSLIAASEICRKMVWSLILLRGGRRRRREKRENEGGGGGGDEEENNKAWLLGESGFGFGGGEVSGDPQSSFRFSFGSQVEMESISLNSAATVLLVNLEKGGCGDGDGDGDGNGGSESSKWRRMESLERSVSPVAGMLLRFSFSEIRSASRDFSKGRVLGRGALSCVYRGRLGFGRAVAIKRLDNEDKECAKAFCRELTIACSLHHPNVVPLLGFCIDPQGLFLVYKYVSGGSLGHHLHEKKKGRRHSSLSWSVRYKVAIGVAQAVAYLHDGTDRCIVHRDIKPSNILLSSKNTPKLCDFGLATWTPAPSIPFLCKTVKGTFGYLAPEYFQHGKVSDKMDVYAFGVVLLELITGRKPIETRREENLVLWARPLLQREGVAGELIDPQIEHGSYNWSQMSRMVRAAAACINNDDSQRPSINQVITMLQGEEEQCKRGSVAARNGCVVQTKNDMKSHMALAMLGVSDLDEDDLHCR